MRLVGPSENTQRFENDVPMYVHDATNTPLPARLITSTFALNSVRTKSTRKERFLNQLRKLNVSNGVNGWLTTLT